MENFQDLTMIKSNIRQYFYKKISRQTVSLQSVGKRLCHYVRIPNSTNFYGMHIHEYGDCTLPFDRTGEHYSYREAVHPQHSGDLIPLMGNQGYAWTAFYDKRITIPEIIGRSVVIHAMPDDFMTQPSGNSGMKIGCGIIR